MTGWLAGIATTAAGLAAGAALYAGLVEHPGRVGGGPLIAVAQFRLGQPRAGALLAALAGVGAVAAAAVWLAGAGRGWLAAALLLALLAPYTRVALAPTVRRLLDRGLEPDTPEAERLLRRWGPLHLVRAGIALLAFVLMLRALAGP